MSQARRTALASLLALLAPSCRPAAPVKEALASLAPGAAVTPCDVHMHRLPPEERDLGVLRMGAIVPTLRFFLLADAQGFRRIRTAEELVAQFAPVKTPSRALAFAVALSTAWPVTVVEPPSGAHLIASLPLPPTTVERRGDDFVVRLFETPPAGDCGPHVTNAVDFRVSSDGKVVAIHSEPLWADHNTRCEE